MDLKYNEMWKAWNNADGDDDDRPATVAELFKRDLVLSWKQLNVTVVKKNPKLFGWSEIVNKQILYNGKKAPNQHSYNMCALSLTTLNVFKSNSL